MNQPPNAEETPGHPCDFCEEGQVRLVIKPVELFQMSRDGDYVALEQVPVGVCDSCKERYYHASVFSQAESVHLDPASTRVVEVRSARYVPDPDLPPLSEWPSAIRPA